MRFVRSWSLRSAEGSARDALKARRQRRAGSMGAMRWVDDRWRVLRVRSPSVAHRCIVTDVCMYAGSTWFETMGLAQFLSRRWQASTQALSETAQRVCAFLRNGIAQTQEVSNQVVGFDTAWELAPRESPGPCNLVTGDLSDGLCVGTARCVLLARTTTKDSSWLDGVPRTVSLEPRVTHRQLDVRATPERTASLIQWWVRFSDSFWRGDCVHPPRDNPRP